MTVDVAIDRPRAVTPFESEFRALYDAAGTIAPPPVRSMRVAAFDAFRRLGFPTTKNEDWHFTSVAPIAEHTFRLAAPETTKRAGEAGEPVSANRREVSRRKGDSPRQQST